MTLSTTSSQVVYNGDGATTLFPIPFYFILDGHLIVSKKLISSGAVTTLVLGTDYTLVGAGVFAGGALTTIGAGSPISNLYTLTIRRVVPLTQLVDYVPHSGFDADVTETALDLLTMEIQQLSQDVANLLVSSLGALTFQNIGTGAGHVFAGNSGAVFQFKTLAASGNATVTETGDTITIGASGAAVDVTASYTWTGFHTWSKQAARTVPSQVLKSLQNGTDIADSAILLANDYATAFDIRKRTDVAVEAPVDSSWGGNFGIYLQHLVFGTDGAYGTLCGGIRAQVETTQARNGSLVNDCVVFYGGLYNNGIDVGGFGFHLDAYHVGTVSGGAVVGHTTYGTNIEMTKSVAGGTALCFFGRTLGAQKTDYGAIFCGTNPGFARGIQFGSPTYASGGVVGGGTGVKTLFDVGLDFTWGSYAQAQAQFSRDDYIILSGVNQAQSAVPDQTCRMRWNSATGDFELRNGNALRFGVNLTTGLIKQASQDAISLQGTGPGWAFRINSNNRTSGSVGGAGGASAPPASPDTYLVVQLDGITRKIPLYNP
jgi:hypothetical protein